ncbi:hypothetical protein [Streptomyces sp. NBC_00052]|nr:hypothetical protein [Streptomyces sp. NBC_00052]MCX5504891.1 hypothetical protein [Streptomyces sp. NBC_00052]
MDLRELDPIRLKRIPEKDVSPRDIRWLSQIDVERAVLEERWGAPEIAHDDFAEWFCFAFSPAAEEAFILLRQVDHPRYLFRGPATGPLASGLGMTVSPCRRNDLGGGVTGPGGVRRRR